MLTLAALNGSMYIKIRSGVNGYLGGIIGFNNIQINTSIMNNLTVIGDFTTFTGGLIGYSSRSSIILVDSVNNGDVSGIDNVGGLIGFIDYSSSTSLNNSANTGNILGGKNVGGLIGLSYSYELILNTTSNQGEITGTDGVGGLIGSNNRLDNMYKTITIVQSYNTGTISGNFNVGGIYGMINCAETNILNSFNSGQVIGTESGQSVGGIIGTHISNYSLLIDRVFNSGEITGGGDAGGFIGYNNNYNNANVNIRNSYNAGTVSSTKTDVGGFVGLHNGSSNLSIMDSYNSGMITGNYRIGGFVGNANNLYLYNSVNFGNIESLIETNDIGSIFGTVKDIPIDVENVYYSGKVYYNNVEIQGIQFGTEITDYAVYTNMFFIETLSWSIDIWNISVIDIENGSYPTFE